MTEHWKGAKWTTVAIPDRADDHLSSIDCVSSSDCWSVGSAGTGVLIEHWNGTDWSMVHTPPVTGTISQLNSVTCTSSLDCWAAGDRGVGDDAGDPVYAMAEHWNGSTWSVVSVPNGTVAKEHPPTYLTGVSCVGPADCWASGDYDLFFGLSDWVTPVFAHWNGTRWTTTTTADGSQDGTGVAGITCISSSECWAVGSRNDGSDGNSQTLTERWNGTRWSIVKTPDVSTSSDDRLASVTCTSGSNCWAVGSELGYDGPPTPALTEHWNGSNWSIAPSAQVSKKSDYFLNSVTCTDADDCWSVGNSASGALVEWLVRPTSISIRPTSGPPGTRVTVWGVGFTFDKPVTVTYQSDHSGKAVETNLACNASTTVNGVFSCKVSIPVLNAGLPGPHTVTATSGGSTASASFDLTGERLPTSAGARQAQGWWGSS